MNLADRYISYRLKYGVRKSIIRTAIDADMDVEQVARTLGFNWSRLNPDNPVRNEAAQRYMPKLAKYRRNKAQGVEK
jgi:hypothetical protein